MKLAFATIGEAPRDDVVPILEARLSSQVEILQAGVLDHLDPDEILSLNAGDDSLHMVTRTRDGTAYRLSYARTLPRMQQVVDGLVDQGADLVVILCGADWTPIKSSVPVVNPGKLFPNLIQALGNGLKLGVIKPDAGQISHTEKQFRELGLDAVVTAASPYQPNRLELAKEAAQHLKEHDVELVWMTCIGMDETMRSAVNSVLPKPIILAQSILAKVIDELTTTPTTTQQPQEGVHA